VLSSIVIIAIVVLLAFIISALPLYFAVKFLGGKTSLIKTAFVTFISGVIVSGIQYRFKTFGGLIAFFVLIWIYHEVFRLNWSKSFLAWLLQFVFIAIFYFIALLIVAALIGISVLGVLM
jgi:hypothetical protein